MQKRLELDEVMKRSSATVAIRNCWRNGAFERYGAYGDGSVLHLPALELKELPNLPSGAFTHVKRLYLRGAQGDAAQVRGFVRGFTGLETLDVSGSGLTEVPVAPGDLVKLSRLDLSGNRIVVDTAIQRSLNDLHALEYLDLGNNPVHRLDVSAMSHLKALNLRSTDLQEWPTGAHQLPELTWLDLRDSKVASLPDAVFQGDALIKTDLTGAPLNAQAQAALEAARQRIELSKGLSADTLSRFAREEVPATFPPTESGFSIARHLLPLPEIPAGEGAAHFARRLQRLNPTLADDAALQAIEQMRKGGATDIQIGEQIAGWEQTFETLTRRLNSWLYTRESRGNGWVISSGSRNLAALRILESWREGLIASDGAVDHVLNLDGLQLGDIPELPAEFSHVGTLDLNGVRLSAPGSNGFLKAFTQVRTLRLSGNELEVLPEAIADMAKLERLDLSSNKISAPEHLYGQLDNLEHLTSLDLGYNDLEAFDMGDLRRLVMLDLRNNRLTEWPDGVLDSGTLRTLNLSSNDITSIPPDAFDGNHDVLMSDTDLSDNYDLSLESLQQMRAYREANALGAVLGIGPSDLDEMIVDASGEGGGGSAGIQADERLPDEPPAATKKAPWLKNATPEELPVKELIWNQLAAEPGNAAFFHLIDMLQETREFSVVNADLTRRVWTVMEAAASNSELREVLFANSTTHGTCVDGRILTFSELESRVFIHNTVIDIPAGNPVARGQALLKLSRQLFRLDKIDKLARKATTGMSYADEAEVRLRFRIGLTDGWNDGLVLPGQPKTMKFSSGVSAADLVNARNAVIKAEAGDEFFEDMIQRDYWADYLKEKYPETFKQLDEVENQGGSEDEAGSADDPVLMNKLFELAIPRNEKLIELSRKEVAALEASQVSAEQPGPSKKS